MLEDINKSKMSFEKYVELKGKTITRSYSERYKWVDKFLYVFSWFGNAVSIFLAYFFILELFSASFSHASNGLIISLSIIFFLTMFELLKRYVFSMFSMEYIKQQFNVFNKNMIGFIIGTTLLVGGSFYFSLNGAQKFIDNKKVFETETVKSVKTEIDSVTNYYNITLIQPLMENNKQLNAQNTDYFNESTKSKFTTKYTALIDANNKKIETYNNKINVYELERDRKIQEIKQTSDTKLSNNLKANSSNIVSFILISAVIELIIVLGIYFDKYYDWKTVKEYEETVVSTSNFKQWHKYNFILEMICNSAKEVGNKIASANDIIEMSKSAKTPIVKSELDKFIKVLYTLDILAKEGNRHILNMQMDNAKIALRNFYGIK